MKICFWKTTSAKPIWVPGGDEGHRVTFISRVARTSQWRCRSRGSIWTLVTAAPVVQGKTLTLPRGASHAGQAKAKRRPRRSSSLPSSQTASFRNVLVVDCMAKPGHILRSLDILGHLLNLNWHRNRACAVVLEHASKSGEFPEVDSVRSLPQLPRMRRRRPWRSMNPGCRQIPSLSCMAGYGYLGRCRGCVQSPWRVGN